MKNNEITEEEKRQKHEQMDKIVFERTDELTAKKLDGEINPPSDKESKRLAAEAEKDRHLAEAAKLDAFVAEEEQKAYKLLQEAKENDNESEKKDLEAGAAQAKANASNYKLEADEERKKAASIVTESETKASETLVSPLTTVPSPVEKETEAESQPTAGDASNHQQPQNSTPITPASSLVDSPLTESHNNEQSQDLHKEVETESHSPSAELKTQLIETKKAVADLEQATDDVKNTKSTESESEQTVPTEDKEKPGLIGTIISAVGNVASSVVHKIAGDDKTNESKTQDQVEDADRPGSSVVNSAQDLAAELAQKAQDLANKQAKAAKDLAILKTTQEKIGQGLAQKDKAAADAKEIEDAKVAKAAAEAKEIEDAKIAKTAEGAKAGEAEAKVAKEAEAKADAKTKEAEAKVAKDVDAKAGEAKTKAAEAKVAKDVDAKAEDAKTKEAEAARAKSIADRIAKLGERVTEATDKSKEASDASKKAEDDAHELESELVDETRPNAIKLSNELSALIEAKKTILEKKEEADNELKAKLEEKEKADKEEQTKSDAYKIAHDKVIAKTSELATLKSQKLNSQSVEDELVSVTGELKKTELELSEAKSKASILRGNLSSFEAEVNKNETDLKSNSEEIKNSTISSNKANKELDKLNKSSTEAREKANLAKKASVDSNKVLEQSLAELHNTQTYFSILDNFKNSKTDEVINTLKDKSNTSFDRNFIPEGENDSVLSKAIESNNPDIVKLLLEQHSFVDCVIDQNTDETNLMRAASIDNLSEEIADLLVGHSQNSSLINKSRKTASDISKTSNNNNIAQLIEELQLKKKTPKDSEPVDTPDDVPTIPVNIPSNDTPTLPDNVPSTKKEKVKDILPKSTKKEKVKDILPKFDHSLDELTKSSALSSSLFSLPAIFGCSSQVANIIKPYLPLVENYSLFSQLRSTVNEITSGFSVQGQNASKSLFKQMLGCSAVITIAVAAAKAVSTFYSKWKEDKGLLRSGGEAIYEAGSSVAESGVGLVAGTIVAGTSAGLALPVLAPAAAVFAGSYFASKISQNIVKPVLGKFTEMVLSKGEKSIQK